MTKEQLEREMKPNSLSLINLMLVGVDQIQDIAIKKTFDGSGSKGTCTEQIYFKFGGMSFKIKETAHSVSNQRRGDSSEMVRFSYSLIAFINFKSLPTQELVHIENTLLASDMHVIKHCSVRGECPLPELADAIKNTVKEHHESKIEEVYNRMFPTISF